MAVDNIRNEIGYQRENQTNIEQAGNWLTDSGYCKCSNIRRLTWHSFQFPLKHDSVTSQLFSIYYLTPSIVPIFTGLLQDDKSLNQFIAKRLLFLAFSRFDLGHNCFLMKIESYFS